MSNRYRTDLTIHTACFFDLDKKLVTCQDPFESVKYVSISRSKPKDFETMQDIQDINYRLGEVLKPSINLLHWYKESKLNWNKYVSLFRSQVEKVTYTYSENRAIGLAIVLSELFPYEKEVTFCCWESSVDSKCHRKLIANWLPVEMIGSIN